MRGFRALNIVSAAQLPLKCISKAQGRTVQPLTLTELEYKLITKRCIILRHLLSGLRPDLKQELQATSINYAHSQASALLHTQRVHSSKQT